MSDDEINEIPPERVLDRESILRAKLKEALQDRDEARRELLKTISCIEQAVDFHQVHNQSFQASVIRNLLENINQRRKHE
jgi:uncharacterized protein YqeY